MSQAYCILSPARNIAPPEGRQRHQENAESDRKRFRPSVQVDNQFQARHKGRCVGLVMFRLHFASLDLRINGSNPTDRGLCHSGWGPATLFSHA